MLFIQHFINLRNNQMKYHRWEVQRVDIGDNVEVHETVGGCVLPDNSQKKFEVYFGPFVLLQVVLLLFASSMVCSIRHELARHQEQKHFFSSTSYIMAHMAYVLSIGVPLLYLFQREENGATYHLLVFGIFLIDLGTLISVFAPKILSSDNTATQL